MKTERIWGYYRVIDETPNMKVKELVVEPGKSLSMQRHFKRNEFWVIQSGACVVNLESESVPLIQHEIMAIPVEAWHQLTNPYNEPCHVMEVQYGDACDEADIERQALK